MYTLIPGLFDLSLISEGSFCSNESESYSSNSMWMITVVTTRRMSGYATGIQMDSCHQMMLEDLKIWI